MGGNSKGAKKRGCKCKGDGEILLGGGSGFTIIWFRVVGNKEEGYEKIREISSAGNQTHDGRTHSVWSRWVGISKS